LRIEWVDGVVRFVREEIDPEWRNEMNLTRQITLELKSGKATVADLAVSLGAKEDTVSKTLRRHRDKFIQLGKEWALKY
jgi:Fic family protein